MTDATSRQGSSPGDRFPEGSHPYEPGVAGLAAAVQNLSFAGDLAAVQDIVLKSGRGLTGADGATFVLRDGDMCFYGDEDGITPLWKGQHFPLEAHISLWSMVHRRSVAIEDVSVDERVPHDGTSVKSLVVVPIRPADPLGAIGTYWEQRHVATAEEVELLEALAHSQ